jgi:hypothetical protein
MLAVRIIADPIRSATDHGMSLDTPVGLTNYRSGNGGLFIALALFTLYCLVSSRRHLVGLTLVATLMGVILVLRGASAAVDATLAEQVRLLLAEAVFLTLSVLGILLERARGRSDDWLLRPAFAPASSGPEHEHGVRGAGAEAGLADRTLMRH